MFKILYRFSELGLECEYLVLDTSITTPFILRDPGSVNGSEGYESRNGEENNRRQKMGTDIP